MTTLTAITTYTGVVPVKDSQTSQVFTTAVGTYLDFFDAGFTPDTNTLVTDMNTLAGEINTVSLNMEGIVEYQGDYAAGTTYATGESVTYDGKEYISKVDANLGNQPDTHTTEWRELDTTEGLAPTVSPTFTGTVTLPTNTIIDIVADTTPQLGGDLDCNDKTLNESSYKQITDGTISETGTHTFAFANGDMQQLTLSGSSITCTFAFSGFISGKVCSMIVDMVNAGAQTVAYPAATLFATGIPPAYSTSGTDRIMILKDADDVYTITAIAFKIGVI